MGGTSVDVSLVSGGELTPTTQGGSTARPRSASRCSTFARSAPEAARRMDRSRRGAQGRARKRRERIRPGLLRPRRHGADRHGRERRARSDRHAHAARRAARARSGARARGRSRSESARNAGTRRRAGPPQGSFGSASREWLAEIRALTAERGADPRGYAILAGGGGGPFTRHAIASEFGIGRCRSAHPGLLGRWPRPLGPAGRPAALVPVRVERDGVEAYPGRPARTSSRSRR